MTNLTRLERPLTRRIGTTKLVVRISNAGVEIRGYRRRTWHLVTWERIASLLSAAPLFIASDTAAGDRKLRGIGATRQPEHEATEKMEAWSAASGQPLTPDP